MAIAAVIIDADRWSGSVDVLAVAPVVGILCEESAPLALADRSDFVIPRRTLGIDEGDPAQLMVAAARVGCHPGQLLVIGDSDAERLAAAVGASSAPFDAVTSASDLAGLIASLDAAERERRGLVGVGPHLEPWPEGEHLDPMLLAEGDRRNVVDRYRYWREEAIVTDLRRRAHPFEVAVENWRFDRNIGAVVRNANAFGAAAVHIVGRRRWNRRGAMATDRYLDVQMHEHIDGLIADARSRDLTVVAIDNVSGAEPLETAEMPSRSLLVFGQEGPGVSGDLVDAADMVCGVTQYGSTRSINAGVASGIAMWAWCLRHAAHGS